jgi:hypothetical protein
MHIIAYTNKSLRKSNNNFKKQRQLAITRIRGRLKLRILK